MKLFIAASFTVVLLFMVNKIHSKPIDTVPYETCSNHALKCRDECYSTSAPEEQQGCDEDYENREKYCKYKYGDGDFIKVQLKPCEHFNSL